jgi:hypothetical protein
MLAVTIQHSVLGMYQIRRPHYSSILVNQKLDLLDEEEIDEPEGQDD